jgi:hypothetical protein
MNEGRIRVFNNGKWSVFCENMAKEASNLFSRAEVVELTNRLFKEHANHLEEADVLLEQITQMAENLSYEVKSGIRDRHDFINMVELAESVETAVKTLIEVGEFVPPSGFDFQTFPGEEEEREEPEEWENTLAATDDIEGSYEDEYEDSLNKMMGAPIDDDNVADAMGFGESELEEDHLDDVIGDVEGELDDVDDATFGVETQDDVRDVRDEIRDVKDAIDDLWDAYRDSEEEGMGDDEMDMDMDMDMGGEDEMDLDLGDEEGEDDFDLEGGEEEGEEPAEGEGMAVGLEGDEEEEEENPFESHRRKGKSLTEAEMSELPVKDRKYRERKASTDVAGTPEEVKLNGEEEVDIPYTEEDETDGENQFGESKLSDGPGAVDSKPTIDDFTLKGKPDGTGLGIREGFNGFRVGDAIFINESRDEWIIQSIEGRKATVRRGRTTTEVDLLDEGVEQADRNLRHHRQQDLMKESQKAWQRCEQSIISEGCVGGVCGLGDGSGAGATGSIGATLVSELSPVTIGGHGVMGGERNNSTVDKTEIYKYIKDNDLHRATRDRAFEDVQYTFNNPLEELNQILDDAILSNDETQTESIDNLYHYNRVVERKYQESKRLNNAFALIESDNEKERTSLLRESAKKKPSPVITRRKEQNNDSDIENLGRTWLNRVSEGLEDV